MKQSMFCPLLAEEVGIVSACIFDDIAVSGVRTAKQLRSVLPCFTANEISKSLSALVEKGYLTKGELIGSGEKAYELGERGEIWWKGYREDFEDYE